MKKYWEHVEIGHKLSPLIKESVSRLHIAHFAAATDDFSPMNLDEEFAKSAGLGSVFAPGLMALAVAEETLRAFAHNMTIVTLSSTFQRLIWPCDTLSAQGIVVRHYLKHDEHRVQFSLWVENQNGDVVMKGQAICLLFKNQEEEKRSGKSHPLLSKASYEELSKRCEIVAKQSHADKHSKYEKELV